LISKEWLEAKRKEIPELVFQQEYLAKFVRFSAGMVKQEYLIDAPTPQYLPIVLGVDLAISEKETAAWSAIVAMGRDFRTGIIYIKEVERFKASFNETWNRLMAAAHRHRPEMIVIEKVQYQAAMVQEMLRKSKYAVRGVTPGGRDKVTRFGPLLTRYEQLMVRHDQSGVPGWFREDLLSFPEGKTKDGCDAAAYAYDELSDQSAGSIWRRLASINDDE
jgi:phage terminase large subunit-like protein